MFLPLSSKKEIPTEKARTTVIDGKSETVLAVAKKDFYIVEKQGSQAEPKIQFNSDQRIIPSTCQIQAQILENYTTLIQIKSDVATYEDQEPTVDMVSGRTIEKSFFLKVWWNEFVRYVKRKAIRKKSQWS